MDWINDWEERDTDLAFEPQAFANRHVRRKHAAIAMTIQVPRKVPPAYEGNDSWLSKRRKEDLH